MDPYQELRVEIRRFLADHSPFNPDDDFIRDIAWNDGPRAMGAAGLLGLCIPPQYGGRGQDYLALAAACEELARADVAHQITMTVHLALTSMAILQWGTDQQRERWLPSLASGDTIATFGLTEPGAGSDAGAIRCRVRREGADYVLNGEKAWISLAATADLFLVFATFDRSLKHRGICAFLVERDTDGVSTTTYHGKLGVRLGNTGSVFLDEVRVPAEQRLGQEGEGFALALSCLSNGLYTVGAGALGIARDAHEQAVQLIHEHAGQFGQRQLPQTALASIASMTAKIERANLLIRQAGHRKNLGVPSNQETSLAKWQAAEAGFSACERVLSLFEVLGAPPFTHVERQLANVKGSVIYGGTREIHTTMQASYALGYRIDRPFRRVPPDADVLSGKSPPPTEVD